jgi:hypothetical protein
MLKRIGLSLVAFFCLIFAAIAQSGTIKGFVYDRANGEPMIFVNVVLEGSNIVVQTDVNGYFSMPQVPEGTYTLTTTLVGYDTARTSVNVIPNAIINKKLYVGRRGQELKEVQVSARKIEKTTQVNAGVTSITPREMKLLPSTGGEPDIAQYLQVVPGVVFTGDQGGQLFIRGGSPVQTGILLDGITIYNPFHSIGLYSVFETDAIRNADVYSAGFNAQYGNRTSAILDVRTKDGNKNRLSGKLSASPIMARAMLEGPLAKAKREGGSSLTFLASVKHSYLDKTSKQLYGGFGEQFAGGLPYAFTDMFGKVSLNTESGSKFNVFGFNFNDQAKALHPITHDERASFQWNAFGAGTTFIVTPNSSASIINGKFAYSKYLIDYTEANYIPANALSSGKRSSGIDGFEGGLDFTYYLPGYSQLKYGIEVSGLHTSLDYYNAAGVSTRLDRRNTSAALFAMFRKNFNSKFLFEPGLRAQYYSAVSTVSIEPRIGLKYNITNAVRLKAATGLYSQNIISTKSDRDIVNFFTGFVLSPDQTVYNTEFQALKNNLQRSFHLMGGLEVDINDVELNLEPWYKFFNPNIELSRIQVKDGDPDFVAGRGDALGVDLSARYNKERWYLWGVVSYQKVLYETLVLENNLVTNDPKGTLVSIPMVQSYPPPFDRRINTNLLIAYTAGKKRDWELSTRYNLGSPFPFTQTQGFYEQINMLSNGLNTNTNVLNGQLGLIYANQINGGRLSYYHRWDISARKRFTLSEFSNIEATLSVGNVLNRNNIFYIDRLENVRVYQLPIFPSLNVTWNF